ncbi:unnamed protein product [Mytilus coruscus]|uniref:SRCR domain-containing protein n=1 Tax=Mytilus coruscus TaxID=42192 RepID=A0A6J8CFA5_MYTCO|nr:unnamed protein product [Mytilus coruscus]
MNGFLLGDLRISLGKLEILHNNTWGTVCSGTFDETEARVACKQLGYRNGSVLEKTVTTGTSIVWLNTIKCNGGENTLTDCLHPEWGKHSCSHGNVVGIRCFEGEGDVRIVSGRLEIYYYGTWGTICDDNFDDRDATVACRQLGYNSGKFVGAKENGTGPIWLDDLHCSGNEPTLGNCSNSGLGEVDCVHRQDVGIECSDSKEGAIRINSNKYELTESMQESGRLEIFHNNEWGSVCEDDFEKTDAEVACRQLGYKKDKNTLGQGGWLLLFSLQYTLYMIAVEDIHDKIGYVTNIFKTKQWKIEAVIVVLRLHKSYQLKRIVNGIRIISIYGDV